MSFLLIPPIVTKKNVGFSLIQAGHMAFPESLIINMAGWSALNLLQHWRHEIGECLAGNRDRFCIVSGLVFCDDESIPSEWWTGYFEEDHAKIHYQVLSLASCGNWTTPDQWWKNILPYDHSVSEWVVTAQELMTWCKQCDVLLSAIDAVQDD